MDSVKELAKMIDHSLLHPTLTDNEMREGCEMAKNYQIASVCVKPYAVSQALEWLKGSDVMVGTVAGFPHGNSSIDIKILETERACKDGALEIDVVINVGKALQEDWDYILREISTLTNTAHQYGTTIKIIFENDFLPGDNFKIKLCEICNSAKVDFAKTSTGYGFIKDKDGKYFYRGATEHDIRLMRKYCDPGIQIKAAGCIRTLDELLKAKSLGATRIGTSSTVAILEEAKKRFGTLEDSKPTVFGESLGY